MEPKIVIHGKRIALHISGAPRLRLKQNSSKGTIFLNSWIAQVWIQNGVGQKCSSALGLRSIFRGLGWRF